MKLAVVTSDKRMQRIAEECEKWAKVTRLYPFDDAITGEEDALVLPVKGCDANGHIIIDNGKYRFSESFWEYFAQRPIFTGIHQPFISELAQVHYYMEDEAMRHQNAQYTAEGILFLLIDHTSKSIQDLVVDIIGYGACGKAIADWLQALHVTTRIIRREPSTASQVFSLEQYQHIECGDVIIHTAPVKTIPDVVWNRWQKKPLVIDIATGDIYKGMDWQKYGIQYLKAGNLPAIFAYESSAAAIARYIRGKLQW